MKKTQRQLRTWTITPPSRTPTAPPAPAIAPQTASARLRSLPSANVVRMIDRAAGETIAPPRTCAPRAMSSIASDCDSPHASDAPANSAMPAMNRRRRPSRSAATAPGPVRGTPAEQQEPSEDQRVGVEHPRQALLGEADLVLDARQRDVHDGRVEHHHELGHRDDGEHRVGAGPNLPDRSLGAGEDDLRAFLHGPHDRPEPGEPSSPDGGDCPPITVIRRRLLTCLAA